MDYKNLAISTSTIKAYLRTETQRTIAHVEKMKDIPDVWT